MQWSLGLRFRGFSVQVSGPRPCVSAYSGLCVPEFLSEESLSSCTPRMVGVYVHDRWWKGPIEVCGDPGQGGGAGRDCLLLLRVDLLLFGLGPKPSPENAPIPTTYRCR